MAPLEEELARARDLDEAALADAVESVGFECTRCGACCRGEADDPHVATAFPDEVRRLQAATGGGWRDVARPVPFGLDDDGTGETFEWALAVDDCGDCAFYDDGGPDDQGSCTVHPDRPLICRTYPFSVDVGGTVPMGAVVESVGPLQVHECEGLGRDIDRDDAEALAATLKRRAVRELEEAIAVREAYAPADPGPGEVVVHDSEGAKDVDGRPLER